MAKGEAKPKPTGNKQLLKTVKKCARDQLKSTGNWDSGCQEVITVLEISGRLVVRNNQKVDRATNFS